MPHPDVPVSLTLPNLLSTFFAGLGSLNKPPLSCKTKSSGSTKVVPSVFDILMVARDLCTNIPSVLLFEPLGKMFHDLARAAIARKIGCM